MNPEIVCILLSTVKTWGELFFKKYFFKKYEGKEHSLSEVERK